MCAIHEEKTKIIFINNFIIENNILYIRIIQNIFKF
jgi:hypothetical protein